jgi:NADPH:quinone reductase
VDAAGPGTDVSPGARLAVAGETGAYAELLTVPARRAVRVPDGIASVAAAAVLMQGLTAHGLVTSCAPVEAGQRVLVLAAGGGVGQLLVQLAKQRGAEVAAVASTAEKRAAARAAGADRVVGYEEFETDGARYDVVFDGVGAATFESSLGKVAPRGTLAVFGMASGPVPAVQPQELQSRGSIHLTWFAMNDFTRDGELAERAESLFSDMASARLTVHVADVLALDDAASAHARLESRAVQGKLLLAP